MRACPHDGKGAGAMADRLGPDADHTTPPTIRVLLIEDNEGDYVLTGEWLAESEDTHFTLDWLTDPDAALETLAANRHDVCLLDYHLGPRNGLELLREALRRGCTIPLILLTG